MKAEDLINALGKRLPDALARDLIDNFLALRQDVITATLGRASPGKFVETVVQILQFLDAGSYDQAPSVDAFLRQIESRSSSVPDGLRVCGSRIARAMYTLRSRRNVTHKGEVDPNTFDLQFLHHGAQWIVAEVLRTVSGVSMEEAGKLVETVQAPAGGLVEDFGGRKLVLEELTAKQEALVLLHSHYPEKVMPESVVRSMDRFAKKTVGNAVRGLWADKLVDGDPQSGYRLTGRGFREAVRTVQRHMQN